MKTKLWLALPLLVATGTAVGAPTAPKQVPPSSIKKFEDFKKTTKVIDVKKPTVTAVRVPGAAVQPWCGIIVATGKFACLAATVKCVSSVLLVQPGTTASYSCELDCHGQVYADADGSCECDIKYDTCTAA